MQPSDESFLLNGLSFKLSDNYMATDGNLTSGQLVSLPTYEVDSSMSYRFANVNITVRQIPKHCFQKGLKCIYKLPEE